jgi:hypothetical protein
MSNKIWMWSLKWPQRGQKGRLENGHCSPSTNPISTREASTRESQHGTCNYTTLTIVTFLTTFNSSLQEYEKEPRWTMNPLVWSHKPSFYNCLYCTNQTWKTPNVMDQAPSCSIKINYDNVNVIMHAWLLLWKDFHYFSTNQLGPYPFQYMHMSPNLCFFGEVFYTLNSTAIESVPYNCHVTQTRLKISP